MTGLMASCGVQAGRRQILDPPDLPAATWFSRWRKASGLIMDERDHLPKYAAEQGLTEEEDVGSGMEEKAKEFVAKGAEVYAKA